MQMSRVAVIGSGGSGKSYVAGELGRLLDAPVTHLDAVYYDDEWTPLPAEKFETIQRDLVAEPRWIIDGNYNSTLHLRLQACDTVILVDVPTVVALWGVLSRQARHGAGQHDAGVYNRINWSFIRYVASYRRRMRPQVLAKIRRHAAGKQVVFLRSRSHARRWLKQVAVSR